MRRFTQRWRIWAAWSAAVVGLYAIAGFFVVPRIARWQIEKQSRALLHRNATVTAVRFNPFTLAAVVEGLDLKDRDGADLLHLDRLSVNFQVAGVFRRAFRFREIVLESPQVVARIAADGRLSIADLFESKPDEKPEGEKSSLPRVLIDRFTMRSGAAKFVDESKTPAFTLPIAPLNLELHELSTIPDESGGHRIALGLEGGAQIRWSGRQTVKPLHLQGRIDVTGARLPRFWAYFASTIPLEMRSGKVDISCSYEIREGPDGAPSIDVNDGKVAVQELALRPRSGDADWLVVPELDLTGARVLWPEARAEVGDIRVKGLQALAYLDENGALNWRSAVPANSAAPERSAATTDASKSWTAKIGVVELLGGALRFEDRTHEPSIVTDLADIGLKLENVTTDLQAQVPTKLKARVNDGGELEVSGTIAPGPPSIDLAVALGGIDLRPYVPYAIRLPGLDLRSGVASTSGKLRVGPGPPKIQYDGGLELADLNVAGGGSDRLLACRRITVRGARVSVAPEKIRIAAIDVDAAFAKVEIDRDGRVNIKEILAGRSAPSPAPEPPAPVPAPPAKGEPLDLGIGTIAIRDASAEYTDLSVILPFGTKIHAINGSLKDLSMSAPAPASLALEGRISDTGYFKADGTMRIARPFAATDILLIFRGVEMPELTPYSAQFAGYSISKGVLDVDIRYGIKDGRLVGDHRVIAKDLILGPKVEGAKGPGVPVRLAIALLKDKDGRIDLEVPIEGTVNSPTFNYKSVFWQAFKTILGNVAKAPFRAIGRLFGADSEDLELVGFASGHSDLPAPEHDKLVKLGPELTAKPELSLEIEGRYDPVVDVEAIRRIRLDQQVDARRAGGQNVEAIVQSLYVESFSAEQLEAERQKFPPEDAAGLYDSLRSQLLAAEEVPESVLEDLARARATAILAALTAPGGLDSSRVKLLDPAPVKRKKQGSELVASEMTLSAGD